MSPDTPQALNAVQARDMHRAFGLLQAGLAEEALPIGKRLAVEAAQAPDTHQLLALCHAETGNIDAAERSFQHALQLAPDHPLLLLNYATMLRKSNRLETALAVLQRAVDARPEFARAWIELGHTSVAAARHQEALSAYERAVALQPDSIPALHGMADAARATGDLPVAESAFRRVIALAPEDRTAAINLGTILRRSGRPDEAIVCFERLANNGDLSPELADARVGALLDDGRLEQALQLARQVARDFPDFVPGLVTLANLLWEHGSQKPGSAQTPDDSPFELFRAAIAKQPHHHGLRTAFAQFLLSARSADEALGEIRILRTHADEPQLALMQAEALEMLGSTQQAGELYSRLHRDWGSQMPAFLNAYTRHLLRARHWDAAAQRATEATRLDPQNQEAWAYLATAWRLLDDPREAWLCDYDRMIGTVEIEPPAGFTDQAEFLDALKTTLNHLHRARREPIQQSLRGGSQTPGRLFGRRDAVLAATQSSLRQGVEHWLATLPDDDRHPFLKRKRSSVRMDGSWSVKLWSSGSHVNHIHPEGWMSSAFYVALPPSVASLSAGASQAGCIQFGQPPVELDLHLSPRRVIRPRPGMLALFPSYMWHGTVPFEDEQPRITVAFDMTPLAD